MRNSILMLLCCAGLAGAQIQYVRSTNLTAATTLLVDDLIVVYRGTNAPMQLRGSNVWAAISFKFLTNTLSTGPVGISNGLSAIWNSNGVATYLRTSVVAYTTNEDSVLKVH